LTRYERIIVKSILNSVTAFRAWGSWAGMTITSPAFTRNGCPEMVICTSPSKTYTNASNGARVFAQPLVLGKGEERDRSALLVDKGTADNGPFLIINQGLQVRNFRPGLLFHDRFPPL
jgi:hypothetical protein